MLQSYDGEMHVFPAVPDDWKEAGYQNLRTEGAFLVTAKRARSKTVYVKISSLAGGSFKLTIGSPEAAYRVRKTSGIKCTKSTDGSWDIYIPKGKSIEFLGSRLKEDQVIEPVAPQADKLNYFGLR
jgi:hypothetical protein